MKKIVLSFLLTLGLVLGAGCASGPGFAEANARIPALATGKGRVYFYRPSTMGAAVRPEVRLDGKVVGKAVSHGYFYVDAAPGDHSVETTTEVERRLSFTLAKEQTRYVRLNISIGFAVGHVYPELVESGTGQNEIANCKYIGGE